VTRDRSALPEAGRHLTTLARDTVDLARDWLSDRAVPAAVPAGVATDAVRVAAAHPADAARRAADADGRRPRDAHLVCTARHHETERGGEDESAHRGKVSRGGATGKPALVRLWYRSDR
jgi:predicted nucleic acid-binding protein